MRRLVPALLAIAYAVAVVAAAWRAPDKGFQAFLGRRVVHVERGELREGDVIERVDRTPVTSTLDYCFRVLTREPGDTVRIETRDREVTVVMEHAPVPWSSLFAALLACVLLAAGVVARRARPADAQARRFYWTAIIYAFVFVGALSWPRLIVHPVLAAGFLCALFAGPGVSLSLALSYGEGGRVAQRALGVLSAALGIACAIGVGLGVHDMASDRGLTIVVACIASQIALLPVHTVVGLWAQLRAHRSATGETRAQLRWLLFGHVLGALPMVAALPFAFADLDHFLIVGYQPFAAAVALLWFVGYGLAVLRVRLADVDALIGYAFATSAAVCAFVFVVLAAGWGTEQIAPGPWGYLVAGVAAAAAFGPLRARVMGWIDRRFFRDRQHYVEALRRAGESLARLREPAQLAREAVELVVAAVRAEGGALQLRAEGEPMVPAGGIAIPVAAGNADPDAWLVLGPRKSGDLYSSQDRDLLAALASQLAVSLANARAYGHIHTMTRTLEAQKTTLEDQTRTLEAQNLEIRELRDKLEDENRYLRARVEAAGAVLIGDSRPMRELQAMIERAGKSDASVLVRGESGTGKGIVARALHAVSGRGAFMHVDCAAIAPSVFESELFGHERGAFTGATRTRRGPIELADGGTLFLDEIGELPLDLQAKLLRVIEDRVVLRVGATTPVSVDARIVVATHRDLAAMVARGEFREDLYFRLRVVELTVPPLRARRADVPALCAALLPRAARRAGRAALPLTDAALAKLMAYTWPGNVRELANVLERALVLADGPAIDAADLDLPERAVPEDAVDAPHGDSAPHGEIMDDIERRRLTAALAAANGNQSHAAKALGMPRTTLINKLRRHGLL
ncbi:MAG: sigma 54-interacting transcriptional regulator [Deltaproteobacteria bacterium]|nr:sigma 54-interacting transcriptional regulator [Deltaproteobacteria bacterium]